MKPHSAKRNMHEDGGVEMNERIRELASEVGISVDYLINTKQIELLEKFAELIVRECAELADEPTSRPFQSYGEKINQHFGVN